MHNNYVIFQDGVRHEGNAYFYKDQYLSVKTYDITIASRKDYMYENRSY